MGDKPKAMWLAWVSLLLLFVLVLVQEVVSSLVVGSEPAWLRPLTLGISLFLCVAALASLKRRHGLSVGGLARSFGLYAFLIGVGQLWLVNVYSLPIVLSCGLLTGAGLVPAAVCLVKEKRIALASASMAVLLMPWVMVALSVALVMVMTINQA
jgi:hypothetical protein